MRDLRKCKVVMLPTKKASKLQINRGGDDWGLEYRELMEYDEKNTLPQTLEISFDDKVIATIDEIPESFLKRYEKKEGKIDEVMVEFQTDWNEDTKLIMVGYGDDPDDYPYKPKPKQNEDGTIMIIHKKKKYTREEVEELIYSAMKDRTYTSTAFFNEWVDKNM